SNAQCQPCVVGQPCDKCGNYPYSCQQRVNMSSDHTVGDHMKPCNVCHGSVVSSSTTFANAALHVNGVKDVQFQNAGSSYDSTTHSCTNTGGGCHGTTTKSGWK